MNIFKKGIQETILRVLIISLIIGFSGQSVSAASNTEIEQLTNTLLELNKATPKDATEMLQVAKKRETLLFLEAKSNPSTFTENATLLEEKKDFPESVQPFIEELSTKEGQLFIVYLDGKDKIKIDYKLKSSEDEKVYDLNFVKNTPDVKPGTQVSAKGIQISTQLVVLDQVEPASTFGLRSVSATNTPSLGEQKTLVILANFSNDTSQPLTKSELEEMIFTGDTSVNAFFKEGSFNQTFITGEVHGWYTLSYDNTNCNSMYSLWSNEADSLAAADGVNIADFSRILYVLPNASCFSIGFGTVGIYPGRSWVVGEHHATSIYSHEFGHNVGIHHANSLKCGSKIIDNYSSCSEEEYGDYFDVMGNFWVVGAADYHFNAPHKMELGWIPDSRVQPITSQGIYRVYHIETGNSLPQILTINKPDTGDIYTLSYRQALGFDSTLTSGITRGTSIHIWQDDFVSQTKLLDTTPGIGDFNAMGDATLADNKKFTDSKNKIEVIQKNHTAEYSEVEVKFALANSPTPTKKPDDIDPKISMTYPTNNSKVPKNKSITLKATATDNVKVVKVEFKKDGKVVCTDRSLPFTCLSFTNSSKNKKITYEAKAWDAAGNDRRSVVTVTTQ